MQYASTRAVDSGLAKSSSDKESANSLFRPPVASDSSETGQLPVPLRAQRIDAAFRHGCGTWQERGGARVEPNGTRKSALTQAAARQGGRVIGCLASKYNRQRNFASRSPRPDGDAIEPNPNKNRSTAIQPLRLSLTRCRNKSFCYLPAFGSAAFPTVTNGKYRL